MRLRGALRQAQGAIRRARGARTLSNPPWPPTSLAAVAYTTVFAGVGVALASRTPAVQAAWLAVLSTNVANLAAHPVVSLVGSAFVTQDSLLDWFGLSLIGLVCAGEALGNLRLGVLAVTTHVLGTLVSESVLGSQIRAGLVPTADRLIIDVGPSFVVAPALVVGVLLGSTLGRVLSGVAFIALEPHLFIGLLHLDVSAVGHTTAIAIAVLVAPALHRDWVRGHDPLQVAGPLAPGPRISAWFSRSP